MLRFRKGSRHSNLSSSLRSYWGPPRLEAATPLSIQKLTQIRKNQSSLWNQKKLPPNELIRWQQAVIAAGHFDAYNYWLFQSASPYEFSQWAKEHQTQYQAWLDWQAKNKFSVQTPDFQRPYLIRGRR